MSRKSLVEFYQVFRTDLTLQQQLDGIIDPSDYANKAVSLGTSRGFEFTHEDVATAIADPIAFLEDSMGEELSDLELQVVSGGSTPSCKTNT